MRAAQKIIGKQQRDGRWKYPNPKEEIRSTEHYDQYETYLQLASLIEMYGFDKRHESVEMAKEFLLGYQTSQGDIRGIYWKQYSPNYTAGIVELLTKAGYANDRRVTKALKWLLSMRQDDGGWVIPARAAGLKLADWISQRTIEPDRSRPFSYLVTGVVLRAFAYNREYQHDEDIAAAAELVLSRLFKRDVYSDRSAPEFWTKFTFPFHFTDLVAVLDPISNMEFSPSHPKIAEGLNWLKTRQLEDGSWNLRMTKGKKPEQPFWRTLSISRLFKQYYSSGSISMD